MFKLHRRRVPPNDGPNPKSNKGLFASNKDRRFHPAPQFLSSICKTNESNICAYIGESYCWKMIILIFTCKPTFPDDSLCSRTRNKYSRKHEGSWPYSSTSSKRECPPNARKDNKNAKLNIPVTDPANADSWKRGSGGNAIIQMSCYTFVKKDLNFVNINGSMSSCKTIFAIMNPTHLQPQGKKYQED
uniref:Uncharacterized protein n=1 Tax=Cucumis melo TaxID=3656 RepID=A0A9I9ED36_CUCME